MELGYQFRALNDISHCLRNQTPGESNFQPNYWQVRIAKTVLKQKTETKTYRKDVNVWAAKR